MGAFSIGIKDHKVSIKRIKNLKKKCSNLNIPIHIKLKPRDKKTPLEKLSNENVLDLLDMFETSSFEYGVLVEDDFDPIPNFNVEIEKAISLMPSNWRLLHLCAGCFWGRIYRDEIMSKLKIGGVLSISLPTDPGLLFRIGRLYLKVFSLKDKYKISPEEFDYMNATEHVNSIFGLSSIIKYNYKDCLKDHYLPFKIRLFDLNLFYNVHISKK